MVDASNLSRNTVTQWISLYSDLLYTWALHKTGSKETAEDLVQETFIAAWQGFKDFKHNSQPKTWLFAILNNKIIDHYRNNSNKQSKTDALSEDDAIAVTNSMFDKNDRWTRDKNISWEEEVNLLDNADFIKVLNGCMGDLPEKWHNVINGKYLLQINVESICQENEITTSNYWQIVHRAKLLLKKCIETMWKS